MVVGAPSVPTSRVPPFSPRGRPGFERLTRADDGSRGARTCPEIWKYDRMSNREPSRALLITGTVGAGKTSAAEAVGELLADAGVPNAVVDLDWLGQSWPTPPGDPFNLEMTVRNLRAVARNYWDAGVERLVLAGVAETGEERARYREAVGVDLAVCRIRVEIPVVHRRLERRHEGQEADLRWHLDRSGQLDRILTDAQVEDVVVDATDLAVPDVAAAVLKAVDW